MKLNCDMGESYGPWEMGVDAAVMPYVDMANIACGFHASDPDTMAKTVELAVRYKVMIGAHPGYPDKVGFGRRSMKHSHDEIRHLIAYQTGALQSICQLYGTTVSYVKPHGALYLDMMENISVFESIVAAISKLEGDLALMILARSDLSEHKKIANKYGVKLIMEAFADRAYTKDGNLTQRSVEGAVFHDAKTIENQVSSLSSTGMVTTIDGSRLKLDAETICVHGDNPESVALIRKLKQSLAK